MQEPVKSYLFLCECGLKARCYVSVFLFTMCDSLVMNAMKSTTNPVVVLNFKAHSSETDQI